MLQRGLSSDAGHRSRQARCRRCGQAPLMIVIYYCKSTAADFLQAARLTSIHGLCSGSRWPRPHVCHLLPACRCDATCCQGPGSVSSHRVRCDLSCRPAPGDRCGPLPPDSRPDAGGAAAEGGQAPAAAGGRHWHARRHDRRCPPSALMSAMSAAVHARLTGPLTGVNQHAASRQTPSGDMHSKRQCRLTLTVGPAHKTSRIRVS